MTNKSISTELVTQIVENSPLGVLVVAHNGEILFCNETLGDFLGIEATSLIGHPESVVFNQFEESRIDPDVYHVNLLPQIRRPQRWLRVERITMPTETQEGLNSIETIYFRDITDVHSLQTEIESLNRQLEDTVPTDTLTGLLNRRAIIQALEPQVSRSRRYHNPLSVIVMTISNFFCEPPNISTTRDQVLITVSNFLRDQIRWVDLIGRTGEMEFTLILPETTKADAEKLATKIKNRLARIDMAENTQATIVMNLHLGITSWKKGDDTRLLIQRVYRALDTAKETTDPKIASL